MIDYQGLLNIFGGGMPADVGGGGWNNEGDFWSTDPGPIPAPGGYPGPYMESWSGKPPPSMGGQFGHPGGGGPGPMNFGGQPGPDGGNGRWGGWANPIRGGGNGRWDGPGHWGGGGGGGGGNGRWGGGGGRYDPRNAANNMIGGGAPRPGGVPAPGGYPGPIPTPAPGGYNSNWKSGFGHPGGGGPGPMNRNRFGRF